MGIFINMVCAFGAVGTNLYTLWQWRGYSNYSVRAVCLFRAVLAFPYGLRFAAVLVGLVDAETRANVGIVLGGPSWLLVWLLPPLFIRPPKVADPTEIAERIAVKTLEKLEEISAGADS